jgi:hypothetical protein
MSKIRDYVRKKLAEQAAAPPRRKWQRRPRVTLEERTTPPCDDLGKPMWLAPLSAAQRHWEFRLVGEGLALNRGRACLNYGCEDQFLDFLTTPEAKKREREHWFIKRQIR